MWVRFDRNIEQQLYTYILHYVHVNGMPRFQTNGEEVRNENVWNLTEIL